MQANNPVSKQECHKYNSIMLCYYLTLRNCLFALFSGHEHDAKSLQENPAGAASGGDDETETENEALENQIVTGPSTSSTIILPRYYNKLLNMFLRTFCLL